MIVTHGNGKGHETAERIGRREGVPPRIMKWRSARNDGPVWHIERTMVMRETRISLPELALVAGTRALLGAGLGLLLADRLPDDRRRAIGWTLLLVGAVTTVPLAFDVLGNSRSDDREGRSDLSRAPAPAY
jgi:hypothetical protein